MPLDPIQIRLIPKSGDCISYRICNQIVNASQTIHALTAFKTNQDMHPVVNQSNDTIFSKANSQLLFKGSSWLAGKDRPLSCSRLDTGYLIEVPDIANFHVTTDKPGITQLDDDNDQKSDCVFEEILLGPPLMLTLAINQLFALHASAVRVKNKAVLFVGESGFGKSTLAQWLNESTPLTRLADDISVLEKTKNKHKLMPDFLQMKLSDEQQQANTEPVELSAIVLLNRQANTAIELTQLDPLNSIKTLVNHSVATQLFDKSLAQQHLAFMSEITQNLPIYSLNYPDGQQYTQPIAEILTKHLN